MRFAAATILLLLAGCVSTQMKGFVGQDLAEVRLRYGEPFNTIDLGNGRRAYQFPHGGGPVQVPGYANTTLAPGQVSTTSAPGYVVDKAPCALTFIAEQQGDRWLVVDYRAPKEIVC